MAAGETPAKKTAKKAAAKKTTAKTTAAASPDDVLQPTESTLYPSGIKLGDRYRHARYPEIEGYAVTLTFMETGCEIVSLETIRDGNSIATRQVDAEQLIHIESGRPVSGRGLKGNLLDIYDVPGRPGID